MAKEKALMLVGSNGLELGVTKEDLKAQYAENATDAELVLFMDQVVANNLDVRKREAYFVKYGHSKAQIVTGYQVYIKRAAESGKLNGYEVEHTFDDKGNITGAKCIIHRKDWEHPFVWTVDMDEFDTGKALWVSKRGFMIKKVCIGQSFRLAFPEDLGGMPYLREELGDMAEEDRVIEKSKPVQPVAEKPKPKPKPAPKPKAEETATGQEPEASKPEVVTPEVVTPVAVPPVAAKPAADLLNEEVRGTIVSVFSAFDVSEADINEVLGTTEWNKDHKDWLLANYRKFESNDLDRINFVALSYSC